MLRYVLMRCLTMIPTLFLISVLVFVIIELPPGDFFESHIAELKALGEDADLAEIEMLRERYGFDDPQVLRYFRWVGAMLTGDFGYSFEYRLPVNEVVGDRLYLTIILSTFTILFTWALAFPIGIYAATHQYSWGDYGLTFVGLMGIAVPNFMLALVMMYFANVWFGVSIGNLMDQQYLGEPMSWEKFRSILSHIWIPVVIIGTAGTAGMIRTLRANLLDELQKQYVVTARAKGLPPGRVLRKYPLRMALNFFIADIGSILPAMISGAEVTAIVLSLETTGPMLIRALQSQDMYLAGSFLMFLAFLTVIGVLLSDIALAFLDPRIRLGAGVRNDREPLPEPGAELPHYVSEAPFDPYEADKAATAQGRFAEASQLRLMWWKFRRHRVAVVAGVFLLVMYASTLVSEFLAPYNLHTRNTDFIYAPPQRVHWFHEGSFVGPYVYGRTMELDMETLQRVYTDDTSDVQRLRFFCRGDPYEFWGMVPGALHLVCPAEGGQMFLLGTDRLGRDVLSRIIYGARISLTIGLLGVTMSFVLGIVIGGLAGYRGGWFDMATQRVIEVLQSIPSIPLWMALAAIIPVTWGPILVYAGITLILGMLDWTGLARAVRSKLLSLREEDYVTAARLMGAGSGRIIGRHMVPGFMSHLIATATLTIPGMILGETALSFLGIGLRPPITSWGILLTESRSVNIIALYPWLMYPVLPVILVVLAFNFLGDGLRDAADPYK